VWPASVEHPLSRAISAKATRGWRDEHGPLKDTAEFCDILHVVEWLRLPVSHAA
jgi:hypothetical protein